MTQQWSLPAWAVLLTTVGGLVLLLVLVLLAVRGAARGRRAEQRLTATGTEVAALREAVTALERRLPATASVAAAAAPAPTAAPDYVITRIGDGDDPARLAGQEPPEPARVVAAPLFADLVLRESVVQAASLVAGLRRAVAPETRHRVRLEMRREVKRSRKQRRSDLRAARRHLAARQRATVDDIGPGPGLDEGSAA